MVSRMSVDNSGDLIGYEGEQAIVQILQDFSQQQNYFSQPISAKGCYSSCRCGFANMYYDNRGYTIYNWSNNDVTEIPYRGIKPP